MSVTNTEISNSSFPLIIFNFTNEKITLENPACIGTNGLSVMTVNKELLNENINQKHFNENKLYGTIADYYTSYDIIVVSEPNSYVTKGNNRLINDIKWRLKLEKTFQPTCVSLGVKDSDNMWYQKNNNCNKCSNIEQLSIFITKCGPNTHQATSGKLTCGLVCQTSDNRVGHVTIGYNIDLTKEQEYYGNLNGNVGAILLGQEIKFSTTKNNKTENGSVIYLPDLKLPDTPFPHITCNTPIKAVLSSKIAEQFLASNLKFKLADIDATCKQDTDVQIEADSSVIDTKIVSWFRYYLG